MAERPDVAKAEKTRGKHPVEDVLYDRLIAAIVDKQLRPGHHLNEVKLSETFDVPRSRVRRVLERLRDDHVVVFKLNRGVFVSRPTPDDALHVFEVRKTLECRAVELACAKAKARDIEHLRGLLEQEREAFQAMRSDVNRKAAEFHFCVAKIAGNPIMERMLVQLIRRCVLVQSVYESETGVLCLTDEHVALVDAIASQHVDRARHLMTHHFEHIVGSLDLSDTRGSALDI